MRKYLVFLTLCLLLTTCKFTDFGDDIGDFDFIAHGSATAISSINNSLLRYPYLYSADGYGRITVYNISDSNTPYIVTSRQIPGLSQQIRNMEYNNRYDNLYLATGNGGIYVINVSNPANPAFVSSYPYINALDLSYKEDYLAVATTNGFVMYYANTSSALSEVDSYDFFISQQPQKILLTYFWAFVFTHNTIEIFDVTNPNNIYWERTLNLTGTFIDYTLIGNYITVVTSNSLQMFDISSPLNASLAKDYGVSKYPQIVRYHSGKLYISYTDRTLYVYEAASINNIYELSLKSFNRKVMDIEFDGFYIYLSNEEDGIKIYRLL